MYGREVFKNAKALVIEEESSLPSGWDELKAKAASRKKLSLQAPPPAPEPEPEPERPSRRRKAPAAELTALDAEEVMRREEQLMLQEREAAVEANSEELSIRKALRKTAAGMGLASLRLTNAMNFVAREIEQRMSEADKIKDVPLVQLGAVLRAGSQLQEKTARVMQAAIELERTAADKPLGDPMAAVGQGEIDAPEAIKKLTRMAGIIERLNKKGPQIVANIPPEAKEDLTDDDEELDDFAELDEED